MVYYFDALIFYFTFLGRIVHFLHHFLSANTRSYFILVIDAYSNGRCCQVMGLTKLDLLIDRISWITIYIMRVTFYALKIKMYFLEKI
jgi:hypothetical protein